MNTQKKRILIFATTYMPFIGGAEVAVQEITKRIPDIDFDIITVNLDGKQAKKEESDNRTIYRVGSGKLGKILFPIRACLMALRLHHKHKYNAFWSIMASYAGFAGLFFSYFHPRIPFILTLQEGDSKKDLKIKFQFVWFLFKRIFRRATVVQAISQYLAEFAVEMNSRSSVVVIPNGVDVAKFNIDVSTQVQELKKKYQKSENDIFLITTSRLVKKNAVRDIILALPNLPRNVKLLIVGGGILLKELKSGAAKAKVFDRVIFVGEVPYDLILPYLKMSDVFVRPSLSEGFGNSFVEAMAAGLPVVATPIGGIVDFIIDKETGLLCEVNNPTSVAQKINLLLNDDDLKQHLIKNASNMVQEKYDWNLIAERMKKDIFYKI